MTTPRFHPPQQHRSQETLDRILDAAERVLDEKSFGEATLAEIMERAGVTVGAFYRRFPDKDALLHHLDERFFSEIHHRVDVELAPERWRDEPASAVVEEFVRQALSLYRARPGLLRSLFLRARIDPVLQDSALQVNRHLIGCLSAVLLARRGELRHPQPESAVPLAVTMLVGFLREVLLFGEVWPDVVARDDGTLGAEAYRLVATYLGV